MSTPAVIRGFDPQPDPPKVYVGTTNGTLSALFADDLSDVWSLPLGGPITGTPAIGNPNISGDPNLTIFVPSGDGTIPAFDEVDDRPADVVDHDGRSPDRHVARPRQRRRLLRSRRLPAPRPRRRTGRELFTSTEITSTRSSPIVADGSVLVGTTHGELVAFGPAPA